ncbi:MAG: hypothetical protein H0X66_08800 [Verrucomicrobia bacterium]|nr:hypothetical protein [Verrucomicrobiota bacterium]
MKTILVTLFSFALIGSQTVFSAATRGLVQDQTCTCCSCEQTDCCVQQSSGAPAEPLASVPANSNVQTQQFVAVVCTILLQQPLSARKRGFVGIHSSPSIPAVPLFKQNCAFLI